MRSRKICGGWHASVASFLLGILSHYCLINTKTINDWATMLSHFTGREGLKWRIPHCKFLAKCVVNCEKSAAALKFYKTLRCFIEPRIPSDRANSAPKILRSAILTPSKRLDNEEINLRSPQLLLVYCKYFFTANLRLSCGCFYFWTGLEVVNNEGSALFTCCGQGLFAKRFGLGCIVSVRKPLAKSAVKWQSSCQNLMSIELDSATACEWEWCGTIFFRMDWRIARP